MLTWTNPVGLAQALLRKYPEQDRLALSGEALRRLVVALPGFADGDYPPKAAYLDAVRWAWMRIADDGDCGNLRETG